MIVSGSGSRFFEDVSVGEDLPSLCKRIDLPRMMAYGAATWDFIRVHYDADHARELGFPGPFVDGQMLGAFLAQHVQDWAGPGAFLRKLGFRNRVMVYPGDSLTCHGLVTVLYKEGEDNPHSLSLWGRVSMGGFAECDLWIENQRSERVVDRANAVIQLPLRAESGQLR
jgi:acyl dehydratase